MKSPMLIPFLLLLACGSDKRQPVVATTDAAIADAGQTDATPTLSDAQRWCAELKAKMNRCDGELECGAKFDEWCALQAATNSHAFEVADTSCVNSTCTSSARSKCRYEQYNDIGLSNAGQALAEAYCQTCTQVSSCLASVSSYSASRAVSDAFVAAWELSDTIVDRIRTECTGAALTVTAGNCPKSFGSCASDIYLSSLPECP